MGRAGCAHAALLLARLRFTRLVRVAPRRSCLLPPSCDPNICSPRRLGCPSCPSHPRLCPRATRTPVLPVAPVALPALRALAFAARLEHSFSLSPPVVLLALRAHLACLPAPRAARRLTTVARARRLARAARRLTTVAPRAVLLGLGLARGRVCVRVTCSKKRGRGFLASKKKCGITGTWLPTPLPSRST